MVGTLVVAKVKVTTVSIVKDSREIVCGRGMGGIYESIKKC
jgi:hypothetical protein